MQSRLTPEDEARIVARYEEWKPGIDPENYGELAAEFGISRGTFARVIDRSGVPKKRERPRTAEQIARPTNEAVHDIVTTALRSEQNYGRAVLAEARVKQLESFIRAHGLEPPE